MPEPYRVLSPSSLRRRWRGAAILFMALVALAWAGPAARAADRQSVDLELILMVDASGSIDSEEFQLQRMGYARAFRNPKVVSAIADGPLGRIAIAYVEWTGPLLQVPIVDWTVLSDPASAVAFADRLDKEPRELFSGGTAVGNAILYGAKSLRDNAFKGTRSVIDMSGDGPTNSGIPADLARDQVAAEGVTVNGLPILSGYDGLDRFYRDNVIGGPGAFVIPARNFDDFSSAIQSKLIREIAGRDTEGTQQAAMGE